MKNLPSIWTLRFPTLPYPDISQLRMTMLQLLVTRIPFSLPPLMVKPSMMMYLTLLQIDFYFRKAHFLHGFQMKLVQYLQLILLLITHLLLHDKLP